MIEGTIRTGNVQDQRRSGQRYLSNLRVASQTSYGKTVRSEKLALVPTLRVGTQVRDTPRRGWTSGASKTGRGASRRAFPRRSVGTRTKKGQQRKSLRKNGGSEAPTRLIQINGESGHD